MAFRLAHSATEIIRLEVAHFLAGLVGEDIKYYPNGGNAGDSLIATGTYHCFDRIGLKYKQINPSTPASSGTIIFAGGGNLIGLYSFLDQGIEKHLPTADKIVVLPHTIRNNEHLLAKLDHRVTLFCRDVTSYLHCKKYAKGANVFLGHDMAFHADIEKILEDSAMPARYGATLEKKLSAFPKYLDKVERRQPVFLLRQDAERVQHDTKTDMDVSEVFMGELSIRESVDQSVWMFLQAISRCAEVVTDRLHVGIGASMLGLPCRLFDNNYGKNSSVHQLSMESRFPRTLLSTDIASLATPAPVAAARLRVRPESKIALTYCVTGQPHIAARLEGSIVAQTRLEASAGLECPYVRVLVTDLPKSGLSAAMLAFFDEIVCDVDGFVDDRFVGRRHFSLAKMRNAALRDAAASGFEWVLLCDSDTVLADYRLEPPASGFGVPEVYWQKSADEDVLASLEQVRHPQADTFSPGNSWFLIAARLFKDVLFNENIYGYGYEDMEYEARLLALGRRNTRTSLRVIHKFHPASERAIERYTEVRNRTIYEYVGSLLHAGQKVDAARPMLAFPARHRDWDGALILLPDSGRAVHWKRRFAGTYEWRDGGLHIEWERAPADRFELKNGELVSDTTLAGPLAPGPAAAQHNSGGRLTFLDQAKIVQQKKLTYLSPAKLESMAACLQSIKEHAIPGDFTEFGVALGGSGICIASELDATRRFVGFDLFGMIPPPGEKDGLIPQGRFNVIKSGKSEGIGGDKYYGYIDDLRNVVIGNFAQFGLRVDGETIALVQGLFEDTLPRQPERTIAFAHLDCDWYDPVMCCLKYVAPRLSPGGFIILDDYNDWPGCKKAADEFVASHPELEVRRLQPHAVLYKRPV